MKPCLLALALVLGTSALAFEEACPNEEANVFAADGGVVCVLTDDCMKEHVGRGRCPSTARADAEAVCLLNSESKKSCIRENAVCREE